MSASAEMSYQPPGPPPYSQYGHPPPAPPPPKPGVVPLAPLDVGTVFSAVIQVWLRSWKVVLSVSAVATVVATLLGLPFLRELMLLLPSNSELSPERALDEAVPHLRRLAWLFPLYAVGWSVVQGVAGGLFAVIARQAVLGRRPSWSQVWQEARPQFARLVGQALVIYLVVGVGLLLCLLPGVLIYTLWSLAIPALMTERLGVGRALSRSYRLVVGDGWRIFAILLLVAVAAQAAAAAVGAPFSAAQLFIAPIDGGSTDAAVWGQVVAGAAAGTVGGMLTLAALPFATLLLYVDQRIRRERYDLQLAEEAASPDQGPPTPRSQ